MKYKNIDTNTVGISNILKYLEHERDRYYRAGISGLFCDSEKCLEISKIIDATIEHLLGLLQERTYRQYSTQGQYKYDEMLRECLNNEEIRNILLEMKEE